MFWFYVEFHKFIKTYTTSMVSCVHQSITQSTANHSSLTPWFMVKILPNASVLIPSVNINILFSLELSATLCIRCVYTRCYTLLNNNWVLYTSLPLCKHKCYRLLTTHFFVPFALLPTLPLSYLYAYNLGQRATNSVVISPLSSSFIIFINFLFAPFSSLSMFFG